MLRLGRDNTLMAVSLLFWGMGTGLYYFVWPIYIKSLGANSVDVGMAMAIGSAAAILTYIPGGIAADRFSRKKNMIATWVIAAPVPLLYAAAQDWRQLLVGIVLMNASQFSNPAIRAYIAKAGEGRDLGRTFTFVFAGASLGMVVSPPFGGLLMESGSMRPLFFASFVLYALSTVAVCLIKDQPRETPSSPAKQGYGHMLVDSRLMILCAFFFAAYVVSGLGRPFSPLYMEEVSGISRPIISSLGTVLSVGSVALALIVGTFSSRLGVVWALVIAESLVLGANSIFLQFSGVVPAALAYFLWGAESPLSTLTQALLARTLAAESFGKGFAILDILSGLATIVVPYVTGWLYSFRPDLPFLAAIILLPFLMAATLSLSRYGLKEPVKA